MLEKRYDLIPNLVDSVQRYLEHESQVLEEVTQRNGRTDDFFLAYVIFRVPPQRAYELLADTRRHAEFRPEVQGIDTVAQHPSGNTDLHRLKVLFVES